MSGGRTIFTVVAFAALIAVAGAAMVEPGLPDWNECERPDAEPDGWVAGGLLLADEPVPDEPEQAAAPGLDVAQPTSEEIAESEVPPNEIPEAFWPAYFEKRPETFLIDPQGTLGAVDFRDRLGFLTYHAGDSSIDLYVYLFKGDQEIPGEVRDEELVERFFSTGRPAAVVYYYMGAPQRTVLHLSPSLTDAVSPAEQRRALESSVMQAFEKVDPADQVEAFLVQMSIRIYWMERMAGLVGPAIGQVSPTGPRAASVEKKTSGAMAKFAPAIERVRQLTLPASALSGVIVVAFGAIAWMRRRMRYEFPDFEVEPRLGGDYAAGVGAVISFASAALPPASQREQVPDYLRRA